MDPADQVDDPVLIAAARHALHDEELIASFAVDADEAEDVAKAKALIDRCVTCRELHADLVAIGSTIHAAGTAAVVGTVRPAPRDFRLTPMDAARLQPGNALQRAAAWLFAGAAMFGRPVGASLAALGLVGLLVGTVGLGQITSSAAPQSEGAGAVGAAASTAPAAAATFDVFGAQSSPSQDDDRSNAGPFATRDSNKQPGAPGALDSRGTGDPTLPLLFAASVLLLVLGLGLVAAGIQHARAWNRPRQRT
jgi:hypothetical protein